MFMSYFFGNWCVIVSMSCRVSVSMFLIFKLMYNPWLADTFAIIKFIPVVKP